MSSFHFESGAGLAVTPKDVTWTPTHEARKPQKGTNPKARVHRRKIRGIF
jgi:hypothetical protein